MKKEFIVKDGKRIRKIDEKNVIKLYLENNSITKIANISNCDRSLIKDILVRNNIQLRSQSEVVKITMTNDFKNKLKESYKDSIEKRKQTCLKKYGLQYASQSIEFQNKIKEGSIKKYGVSHFLKSDAVINKRKETIQEKYNVNNILQVSEIKEKIKNTNKEKYGSEYFFQSDIGKEKVKSFNFDYNEITKKRKETMVVRYGVTNPMFHEELKERNRTNRSKKFNEKLNKALKFFNIELLEKEFIHSHFNHTWKCLVCNNQFSFPWYYIYQGYKCPICFPKPEKGSVLENNLKQFLKDNYIDIKILFNVRDIIGNKELDIYIPEKKLAIEFNGLYWHSEQDINKNLKHYHLNKTIECQQKGIRLIHIFEDKWILKQEIVKHRVLNILNDKKQKRIHARKCSIKEISSQQKNEFLELYHIQGKDNASINLGAFYKDQLISVMTFSKGNISKGSVAEEGVWELNRFCSDYNFHVVGIAGKLLSHFKKNYEWKQIFSYADRRWSDGNLYYKLGFTLDHITNPNYWYVKGLKRIHRFALRKKDNEPKDIPEWFLRRYEGFSRIWDCGNLRFKMLK